MGWAVGKQGQVCVKDNRFPPDVRLLGQRRMRDPFVFLGVGVPSLVCLQIGGSIVFVCEECRVTHLPRAKTKKTRKGKAYMGEGNDSMFVKA